MLFASCERRSAKNNIVLNERIFQWESEFTETAETKEQKKKQQQQKPKRKNKKMTRSKKKLNEKEKLNEKKSRKKAAPKTHCHHMRVCRSRRRRRLCRIKSNKFFEANIME